MDGVFWQFERSKRVNKVGLFARPFWKLPVSIFAEISIARVKEWMLPRDVGIKFVFCAIKSYSNTSVICIKIFIKMLNLAEFDVFDQLSILVRISTTNSNALRARCYFNIPVLFQLYPTISIVGIHIIWWCHCVRRITVGLEKIISSFQTWEEDWCYPLRIMRAFMLLKLRSSSV